MTTAFQIVCPDGKSRHLPYTQIDDAMFDAKLCDTECVFPGAFDGHGHGPCPGGPHNVSPVALLTGGEA